MEKLIDSYLEELYNKPEFIRIIELKKLIDEKYKKEIISLKTKESLYLDSLRYSNNDNKLKEDYNNAKIKLYSMPEVKEYLKCELIINECLDNDLNDIKKEISNKFRLSTSYFKK